MKTTRIFVLVLMMALALAACSSGNSNTNTPPPQNNENGAAQGQADAPPMPSASADDPTLAVAQLGERDYMFVLTVPGLDELMAVDYNERGVSMSISFGAGSNIYVFPNAGQGNQFRATIGGQPCQLIGKMTDGAVTILFRVAEDADFDWDAVAAFDVSIPTTEEGFDNYYTLAKADAEVAPAALNPPTPLTELTVDQSTINLRVRDNGDGTVTLTYTDSAFRPEYIYPWEWVDKSFAAWLSYSWRIQGNNYSVFHTFISTGMAQLTYGDDHVWDGMLFDIVDSFKPFEHTGDGMLDPDVGGTPPPVVSATVDTGGLTLVWTVPVNDSYSAAELSDIAVEINYSVNAATDGESFVREELKFSLDGANVME